MLSPDDPTFALMRIPTMKTLSSSPIPYLSIYSIWIYNNESLMPMDLMLMPLRSYKPFWVMAPPRSETTSLTGRLKTLMESRSYFIKEGTTSRKTLLFDGILYIPSMTILLPDTLGNLKHIMLSDTTIGGLVFDPSSKIMFMVVAFANSLRSTAVPLIPASLPSLVLLLSDRSLIALWTLLPTSPPPTVLILSWSL
jgi:hypothetical protein